TFAFWQRSHPVMRYVAPAGVAVAEPLRLTLPGDEDRDVTLRVETLASGAAGPLIALLERAELRRLIVAFELGASRWWQDASFPVFLKNAVDFLTLSGDEYAGRVHRPGEAVSVHPRAGVERLEVTGPVSLTRSAPRSDGRATLGGLPLAGVYTVQ